MIIKVTESTFIDAFKNMGRGDQFSREGLGLLFDYYEGSGDDNIAKRWRNWRMNAPC